VSFLFSILALGCSMDESGMAVPPVRETIENEPTRLTVVADESKAYADGRVIELVSGHVVLSIGHDDKLGVDSLEVSLGTMVVRGESELVEGIELRNVRVSLYAPQEVPVEWTATGEAGFATMTADLALDGTLTATLHGGRPGVIWDWAGLADISDIRFDVRARRAP
jgi:hypothetical protein